MEQTREELSEMQEFTEEYDPIQRLHFHFTVHQFLL